METYASVDELLKLINKKKAINLLDLKGEAAPVQEETLRETAEAFIESAYRTINTKLGGIYVLPIEDAQAREILKEIEIQYALGSFFASLLDTDKLPARYQRSLDWATKELDAYGGNDIAPATKILAKAKKVNASMSVKNLYSD